MRGELEWFHGQLGLGLKGAHKPCWPDVRLNRLENKAVVVTTVWGLQGQKHRRRRRIVMTKVRNSAAGAHLHAEGAQLHAAGAQLPVTGLPSLRQAGHPVPSPPNSRTVGALTIAAHRQDPGLHAELDACWQSDDYAPSVYSCLSTPQMILALRAAADRGQPGPTWWAP